MISPTPIRCFALSVLLCAESWFSGVVSGPLCYAEEPARFGASIAINGSAEQAVAKDGSAPGWNLYGDPRQASVAVTTKEAKVGKHSIAFTTSYLEATPLETAVISGQTDGASGKDAYAVPPDLKFVVTFWAKGDPELEKQPQMSVWLWSWAEEDGRESSRRIALPFPVTIFPKWHEYEVYFYPGKAKRAAVGFSLTNEHRDELHPDNTVFIDDLVIEAKDGRGLQDITFEDVLAGCEEKLTATWGDSSAQAPLTLWEPELFSDIPMPEAELRRPLYNPLPEGWKELDLSGDWKIRKLEDTLSNPKDDLGTVEEWWKPDLDDTEWPVRTVPSHWHSPDKPDPEGKVGYGVRGREERPDFGGVGWYRHRFALPEDFSGERLLLVFKGADHEATVFLNGENIGKHAGMDHPFEFDVTDKLKRGGQNVLAVRLFDRVSGTWVDRGRSAVGGLFNKVVIHARPAVYATQFLINSRLKQSLIEVDALVTNASEQKRVVRLTALVEPDPHQSKCVEGEGQSSEMDLGEHTLEPGENEISFKVPLEEPVRWSDKNAFLYILRLRMDDTIIGKERFGFREFTVKGRFFYLNGKRVYLIGGHGPMFRGVKRIMIDNANDSMRRGILVRKGLHQNCFLPLGDTTCSIRLQYDICDELGILIYDWAGATWPSDKWFKWRYSHASVVMHALGNETRAKGHYMWLRDAYAHFKKLDKQGRPICTTSGGAPKVIAPPTDVVDFHLYPGGISGHPLDMGLLMRWYNWDTWRWHGQNLPALCWEMGGNRITADPIDVERGRRLLKDEPIDFKQKLVDGIEGLQAKYQMPMGLRWLSLYGIRRYVIDDYDRAVRDGLIPKPPVKWFCGLEWRRQRWVAKHITEECRRLGDLMQGFGYNWLTMNAAALRIEKDGKTELVVWKGFLPRSPDGAFVSTGGYSVYKRCCNPTFVCLDAFDRNVLSGDALKTTVYAINDTTEESKPWSVRIVVKDAAGKSLDDRLAEIGTVKSFKRKLFPYTWQTPGDLPTGLYGIEMFLLSDGKVISDNDYSFFVMHKDELSWQAPQTAKKVALYDPVEADKIPGGITTREVLDDLKIAYQRIESFDQLAAYDVLIIGAKSADTRVDESGRKIAGWVRKGGRLLQYEQWKPGWRGAKISFLPQLSVMRGAGGMVADMIDIRHPVFDGLRRVENWEKWNGQVPETGSGRNGALYTALIGPLNRCVLATGVNRTPRADNKAVKMLLCEVKLGKGLIMLSQAEATRRYKKDCVATKYLQNIVKHILSDERRFARTLEGYEIANVDPHRCGYVGLSDHVNADLEAVPKAWLKELKDGLESCGGLRFRLHGAEMVVADQAEMDLEGEMIFDLAERAKLLTPDWEAEKRKRDRDQGGLNLLRAEGFYFLHKAEEVEDREEIGAYVFRYEDGTIAKERLLDKLNLGSGEKVGDLPGAKYVGHGFYVTRWINPHPEKELESLQVVLDSETARLCVAGITSYLVREKIHD